MNNIAPYTAALLERAKTFVPAPPPAPAEPRLPDTLLLSAVGQMKPADSGGAPTMFNGHPVYTYWGPVAKVGPWKHPATGQEFTITADRMKKWADKLEMARAKGLDVPLVKDHRVDSESTLGYIYGAKIEGDTMFLLIGFVGENARDIGLRNKLSLGIRANLKDSHGNEYGEAIEHCAVTPIPVIHGLGHFVPAA